MRRVFTTDDAEEFARRWRLTVRYPAEKLGQVLNGGLLFGALVFFVILITAQGRELFRVILEQDPPFGRHAVAAVIATVLFSAMLFATYRSILPDMRPGTDYDGFFVRMVAHTGLYFTAAIPWIACIVSLILVRLDLNKAWAEFHKEVENAKATVGSGAAFDNLDEEAKAAIALMEKVLGLVSPAIVVVAVIGSLTLFVFTYLDRGRPSRRDAAIQVLNLAVAAVCCVFAVSAAAFDYHFVAVYRWIGPLASGMLSAISIFAMGLALAWFARVCGLTTYFGAILLLALGIVVAIALRFGPAEEPASSAKPVHKFDDALKKWIDARAKLKGSKKGLPLFIISAQGGGIYAAIESSLFMARLTDANPNFKKHVFAVSSVSGGSIGMGLYDAVTRSSRTCGDDVADSTIEKKLSELVLIPHLDVIAGNIPADAVRRVFSIVIPRKDRAQAFKESLVKICPGLADRLQDRWKPEGESPALVLNTTWMSNGHRVAFAPFSLKEIGDGTLWSFDDLYPHVTPRHRNEEFQPTLAEAVVTSARFPGALPPLALTAYKNTRHLFGDGGYGDASGVTTALDMFNAVKRLRKDPKVEPHVETHLVMLTFDYREVVPREVSGSGFIETRAPIDAVLGVRQNLANIAITRGLKEANGKAKEQLRVSVDTERFAIALGLQLSRTSYNVMSVLIGKAEWCPNTEKTYEDNMILRNSCVAKRILDKIEGGKGS